MYGYSYLSEKEILEEWQAVHKKISSSLRAKFIADARTLALTKLPAHMVEKAIKISPKLDEILLEARRLYELAIDARLEKAERRWEIAKKWGVTYFGPSPDEIRKQMGRESK